MTAVVESRTRIDRPDVRVPRPFLGAGDGLPRWVPWANLVARGVRCKDTGKLALAHGTQPAIDARRSTSESVPHPQRGQRTLASRTAQRQRNVVICVAIWFAVLSGGLVGCKRQPPGSSDTPPLLYCSVDDVFARDVLARYEAQTGRKVRVITDSEAGKTTGLVNRIRSDARRTSGGADVFWSSEIFNTILLAREGLLAPYDSPSAADIPPRYRDAQYRWTAFGLRARVIAFDSEKTDADSLPTTWEAYASEEWASRVAMANPLFGTTRGHLAAMFALWGEERGRAFVEGLADSALVTDGNSAAVRMVLGGAREICMTDTDDVVVASRRNPALRCSYPDMGDGGTLLIPNTVAVVAGGVHPEAARQLVDFLVSAEVERLLAESDSKNVPVREALRDELGMTLPAQTKLSYDAIADAMDGAVRAAREILLK